MEVLAHYLPMVTVAPNVAAVKGFQKIHCRAVEYPKWNAGSLAENDMPCILFQVDSEIKFLIVCQNWQIYYKCKVVQQTHECLHARNGDGASNATT